MKDDTETEMMPESVGGMGVGERTPFFGEPSHLQ